jgi:hypothetical protein
MPASPALSQETLPTLGQGVAVNVISDTGVPPTEYLVWKLLDGDRVLLISTADGEESEVDAGEVVALKLQNPGTPFFIKNGQLAHIERFSIVYDSDFLPVLQQVIQVHGHDAQTVYEIQVKGVTYQMTAVELSDNFRRWCARRGWAWSGEQTTGLLFKWQRLDVPHLEGVTATGLHGQAFVLEDEAFGPDADKYAYVRPTGYSERRVNLKLRGIDPQAVQGAVAALSRLHLPLVMTPIIGWFAAAPLRSRFRNFPVLGVTGTSGYGKTTILLSVAKAFGVMPFDDEALNLQNSTPYAISNYGASTNAFAVWFDEYRKGARRDSKMRLDQLIRDAWDGSSSPRGGMDRDNLTDVTLLPACAPLIVSGEDTFSETSHLDRMVNVHIPRDGRSVEAFHKLTDPVDHGESVHGGTLWGDPLEVAGFHALGRAYLEWLLEQRLHIPTPLDDRQATCQNIVRWGYYLFESYLEEMLGEYNIGSPLPTFDATGLQADYVEASAVNPYDHLIFEGWNASDDSYKPYRWEDSNGWMYLRPLQLIQWGRNLDIPLPGGAPALVGYLKDKYGATVHEDKRPGAVRRSYRFPMARWNEEHPDLSHPYPT